MVQLSNLLFHWWFNEKLTTIHNNGFLFQVLMFGTCSTRVSLHLAILACNKRQQQQLSSPSGCSMGKPLKCSSPFRVFGMLWRLYYHVYITLTHLMDLFLIFRAAQLRMNAMKVAAALPSAETLPSQSCRFNEGRICHEHDPCCLVSRDWVAFSLTWHGYFLGMVLKIIQNSHLLCCFLGPFPVMILWWGKNRPSGTILEHCYKTLLVLKHLGCFPNLKKNRHEQLFLICRWTSFFVGLQKDVKKKSRLQPFKLRQPKTPTPASAGQSTIVANISARKAQRHSTGMCIVSETF